MVHDGDPLREAGDDLHVVLDHQHGLALARLHERISATSSGTSSTETPAIGSSSSMTAARRRAPWRARACACRRARASRPARTARRRGRRGRAPSAPGRAPRVRATAAARSASTRRGAPRRRGARSRAREQREDVRDLERPAEAGRVRRYGGGAVTSLPSSSTVPAVGRQQARQQVEERRLAGAVRADHAEQLALADLERDIGDDGCAADVEPEVPRGEDRGWGGHDPCLARVGRPSRKAWRAVRSCPEWRFRAPS